MGELGDLAWAEGHLRAGLRTLPHGGAALALVRGESAAVVVLGQAAPGRPVEAATPFHICSCAKMFTAAVAARLAADGAFDWDAPIRGVLPAFMLADETVTAQCSFRDLAAMRVGLTRDGVAEWGFRQDAPTAERLARARHMALVAPFRDRVSYSNLCYIALAMAAAQKAGRPFAALFDEIIARPLGLKDSWSEGFGAPPRTAPAQPHMPLGGVARPVRELTGPNSEGSARIYLSARDATRWMGFLLAAFAGSEIGPLGAADVAMMMSPQAVERAPDRRLAPLGGNSVAYGLGLSITSFRGRRLVRHGGGGRGWRHAMMLAPEARAGVMLMTSAESPRIEGLALELLDRLTGGSGDFADAFDAAAAHDAALACQAASAHFPVSAAPAPPPAPGLYANPVTGAVEISAAGDELRFHPLDAPIFTGALASLGGQVYALRFDEPALSPQPLDPLFRLSVAAPDVLETTYWGQLRRVA